MINIDMRPAAALGFTKDDIPLLEAVVEAHVRDSLMGGLESLRHRIAAEGSLSSLSPREAMAAMAEAGVPLVLDAERSDPQELDLKFLVPLRVAVGLSERRDCVVVGVQRPRGPSGVVYPRELEVDDGEWDRRCRLVAERDAAEGGEGSGEGA